MRFALQQPSHTKGHGAFLRKKGYGLVGGTNPPFRRSSRNFRGYLSVAEHVFARPAAMYQFIWTIFSESIGLGDHVVVCPVAFNGAKYGLTRQKTGGTPTGAIYDYT